MVMNVQNAVNQNAPLPGIEALHRDIAFANTYRLELIKLSMTLAGALLAFTVTFRPELQRVTWSGAMWVGWFGLALSMLGGMANMHGWDRYYMSYRDFDHKYRNTTPPTDSSALGKAKRSGITRWRRWAACAQFGGFALGVAGVALFAAMNLDGKQPPAQVGAAAATVPPAIPAAAPAQAVTTSGAARGQQ